MVREVVKRLDDTPASVIHHDAYYRDLAHLPPEERVRVNFDHPDALETELLVEHLEALRSGEAVDVPTYDFSTHTRARATERVEPAPVVVVDGILVLADARLRALMHLKVYVDTAADVRLLRRLRRDTVERGRTPQSVLEQYEASVRPMHLEFVEPSKRHADLVVPEGGYNRVGVDMVVAKLEALRAE